MSTTRTVIAAVSGAAIIVLVLRLRRRLFVATVQGLSMTPALQPGDRLLVHRPRRCAYRVDQIVVLRNPDLPAVRVLNGRDIPALLAKRVVAAGPDGLDVRGDNAAISRDSRQWGPVPYESVVGVLWRPLTGRRRRLPPAGQS